MPKSSMVKLQTFERLLARNDAMSAIHLFQYWLRFEGISQDESWQCVRVSLLQRRWLLAHMMLRDLVMVYPAEALFLKYIVQLSNKFSLYHEALSACDKLLKLEKNYDNLLLLGSIFEKMQKYEHALNVYLQAKILAPQREEIYEALSRVYYARGDADASLAIVRSGLNINPLSHALMLRYGNILAQMNRYDLAEKVYEAIVKQEPNFVSACINLGVAKKELCHYQEAHALYQTVLKQEPNNAGAHNNLGVLYKTEKDFLNAFKSLRKALLLQPNNADTLANIGAILKETNKPSWALYFYKKALALHPHHINAHLDYALIQMLFNQYAIGLFHYEYRQNIKEFQPKLIGLDPKKSYKRGSLLAGQRILVFAEQGFGDAIQFFRFLPELKRRGAYVVFRTRKELKKLFENSAYVDKVILEEEQEAYDAHMPLLSLPYRLNIDVIHYSIPFPYLKILLPRKTLSNKIAFSFGGSPTHKGHRFRHIPPHNFETLINSSNVQFISVQLGPDRDALKECSFYSKIEDGADKITNFVDTAAILSECKLLITSDTSVAHLGGALGIPTWVLLPINPDWRWGQKEEKTFWYPSITLFRQRTKGKWEDVFKEVHERFLASQL